MSTINQQRLINHFIELIKINSESRNEKAIAETLAEQLGELGFSVHRLPVPEAISNGFNIYARLDGNINDTIAISCHMDTVNPGNDIEPIIENGVIRSKGDTILGGDDKSGIAAVMEAVRCIQADNRDHKTIELAFTVHEEGGLQGSKLFDMSYITANKAIVLDSGGAIGAIVTTAPGQQSLRITITGKPAHAGLAPEEGINALTVAADAITNMHEARSLNNTKLEHQTAHMIETFEHAAAKHGAKISIESNRSYNAYHIEDNDPHVQSIMAVFTSIGLTPFTKSTGGGSDANVFNGNGLKTVNISTGMSKVHTTEEFITVDDMTKITEFMYAFLCSNN
jgi:tripeptide aminopeptidase